MTQRVYINESKNKVPAKGEFTLIVDGQSYVSTTEVYVDFYNNDDIKKGCHIIANQGATAAAISFPAYLTNGTHNIAYIKDFENIGLPSGVWGCWTEGEEDFEA